MRAPDGSTGGCFLVLVVLSERLSGSAHAAPMLPLDLPPDVATPDLATAIALLLAPGQRQLHLCARALEVDTGGNQGQPAAQRAGGHAPLIDAPETPTKPHDGATADDTRHLPREVSFPTGLEQLSP